MVVVTDTALGKSTGLSVIDRWGEFDTLVDQIELEGARHESVPWSEESVDLADCVVVLTPHRQFRDSPLFEHAALVVDTRNIVPPAPNVHSI